MKTTTKTAFEKISGNPPSAVIYNTLLERLEAIGPFEVERKATSLHIVNRRAFLGVHYRKDGLLLNIALDHPLEGRRVKKVDRPSRNRFHNEVLLFSPKDVDRELVSWMKQAHQLTLK